MTAAGYRVAPARLDQVAGQYGTLAEALSSAQRAVAGEKVPATAFGQVDEAKAAAKTFEKTMTELGSKLESQVSHLQTVQNGLTASAAGYRRTDAQIAAMYRALLPEDPLPPAGNPAGIGGSADTGAWAQAIAANRTKVSDALTAERTRLASLTDADEIARSQSRIKLYEDILANNRQILKFDPAGNGRIAELVGHIEPGTRNVGLFVPGVNTQMSNFDAYAGLGRSLVAADPTGRTAMVVWADGVFPQNPVVQGPSASYAEAMAPDLKHFTDDLRGEIASHAGSDVALTAIGHSYGGATVGLAETQGLDVDRVLHVESAGMGHGVWSPADLPASQAGVQRYSMTAPLDPIEIAQGNAWGLEWTGIGHGADPDTFPGVTDLETGRSASGDQLWGLSSHSDVLKPGSESWTNIYRVVTSGPTTLDGTFQPDGILEHGVEFLNDGGVLR
ncbi:alpha/beta hydrolase family protein [Amycolatopsis sp. OK19-0408]|uniref:Alpha/beta hydrolase family protein n=1 Tax=Amycolatopsis iheyensis TaxID=2945988 RepID=A0A9X2NL07_9PSEU|nr:alpha/beta hydrolase family protein [Amycolatopsis iheyensis]MCR6488237.1 alpha/beta hydrolase family protein [Amycolatopsis iheyensis]